MKLEIWLNKRGVTKETILDLLQHIPDEMQDMAIDDFCDAETIMKPDEWFYWPNQDRFVLVGQCPNGDGVAIDTKNKPGTIWYVAHELLEIESNNEIIIEVADSPSDYVSKRDDDDFPWDYWDAKEKN